LLKAALFTLICIIEHDLHDLEELFKAYECHKRVQNAEFNAYSVDCGQDLKGIKGVEVAHL
jgi:predicted DNA-binding protein